MPYGARPVPVRALRGGPVRVVSFMHASPHCEPSVSGASVWPLVAAGMMGTDVLEQE